MGIQARPEAVKERHGAEPGIGRCSAAHGVTKPAPDDAKKDAQDRAAEIRVPHQVGAQPLGHRE